MHTRMYTSWELIVANVLLWLRQLQNNINTKVGDLDVPVCRIRQQHSYLVYMTEVSRCLLKVLTQC